MIRSVCCALLLGSAASEVAAPDPAQEKVELALREFSLELRARWEPLTDTVYEFEKRYALVRDLKPAAERARHGAESFRPFLPAEAVAVGDTWRIRVPDVLPLLRQFHAGATSEMHHDSGTGVSAPGDKLLADVTQDWLNEFERIAWLLRLSPRLRQKHGD